VEYKIYVSDGQFNKKYLSNVCSDFDRTEVINNIVNLLVASDYKRWANERINEPYLIKEAALLFESGSYKLLDKVITVYTPEFMRIQRVLKRDVYRTEQQVKTIIKRQYNEEKRLQMADFVIYNDESQLLITQVLKLHQQFLQMPLQVREDLL